MWGPKCEKVRKPWVLRLIGFRRQIVFVSVSASRTTEAMATPANCPVRSQSVSADQLGVELRHNARP